MTGCEGERSAGVTRRTAFSRKPVAVDADPLHLAVTFGPSVRTAIAYSEIALELRSKPIEDAAPSPKN
ncbi:hypothetical protein SAMN05421854_110238 [Amycolatopsis rubida]|uniref:Uncharacterized protein n=1 Tax=Amycolatopsis rubida TaxID=112413 RepID=A0A1I5XHH1_9PSEU|nr:hypothetical protein SAMN05421854_110238 [Amycolatopsis rubida]